MLVSATREVAAKVLTLRYGVSGALSSVLEDLRILGVANVSVRMEDTYESLVDVVSRIFESLCLDKLLENAEQRAQFLSQTAREVLYIISALQYEDLEDLDIEDLKKYYYLIFRKRLEKSSIDEVIKELIRCYVIQDSSYGTLKFPPYINELLSRLKSFMPVIEVRISWTEVRS